MKKSDVILACLYSKYNHEDGWFFFDELFFEDRRIDAFAISYYPSRGVFYTKAFEIKTDKQDMKQELDNPAKRETVRKYANKFYFVTPKGLVDKNLIPENYGLLEITDGNRIYETVEAKHHDCEFIPKETLLHLLHRRNDKGECSLKFVDKPLFRMAGKEISFNDIRNQKFIRDFEKEIIEEYEEKHEIDKLKQFRSDIVSLAESADINVIKEKLETGISSEEVKEEIQAIFKHNKLDWYIKAMRQRIDAIEEAEKELIKKYEKILDK